MGKSNTREEWKSWLKSAFFALGIVILIRTFLFSPYIVEGASMEPTLFNDEKIIVSKWSSTESLNRGDIVIIDGTLEDKFYVKRIIGFPGDQIEMANDQLLVNGKLIPESYLSQNRQSAEKNGLKLTGDFGPISVPENHFFVMGDNRLKSRDSRNGLGFINKEDIIGKSELVLFPFSNLRILE